MAEKDPARETAELRQAFSLLYVDLLIHEGLALSARWRASEGADLAVQEFGAAGRLLADTEWSERSREAAGVLGEVLANYQKAVAAFDTTRTHQYRTLLTEALWDLRRAVLGWREAFDLPDGERPL